MECTRGTQNSKMKIIFVYLYGEFSRGYIHLGIRYFFLIFEAGFKKV